MSRTSLYWFLQLFGWFIYGIVQFIVLSSDGQSIDKMLILGEGLQMAGNILLTHCFRLIIIRFRWLNFKLHKLIPLVMLGILVMTICAFFIWYAFLMLETAENLSEVSAELLGAAIFIEVFESLILYSIWSSAYLIYLYVDRYNKSLKFEASIRETELLNLKAQLNPHFIFNALNSIRALVDEDPSKSKESITRLSNILRNSLNSDRKKLVPLSEELKTVNDYLELEAIRYEERLRTTLNISDDTLDIQVPPLMIQTLVENGIKHGVSKLTKGGDISIDTKRTSNLLVVEIRNSGQLEEATGKGHGLKNTKKRLKLIYGNKASFLLKNENENTVLTQIKIPNENLDN